MTTYGLRPYILLSDSLLYCGGYSALLSNGIVYLDVSGRDKPLHQAGQSFFSEEAILSIQGCRMG